VRGTGRFEICGAGFRIPELKIQVQGLGFRVRRSAPGV
jgi:hypothetical protein